MTPIHKAEVIGVGIASNGKLAPPLLAVSPRPVGGDRNHLLGQPTWSLIPGQGFSERAVIEEK